MNEELDLLRNTTYRLESHFGTEKFRSDEFVEKDLYSLQVRVTKIVAYFLDKDIEKLLQLLYRIDVDENQLKKAMIHPHPASSIAQLIITREMQKARSRAYYKQFH